MAQGLYDTPQSTNPLKKFGGDEMERAGAGLAGIVGGMIGGGQRRRDQRRAKDEMAQRKAQYMNLDTSNLAAGMENTYEDLTVNTGASDMANQQSQQNMANIMGNLGGAAGAGGIASMAQQLANSGNQFAQQNAALLGNQEQQNNMLSAQGAMSVQNAQVAGAQESRQLEKDKVGTLLGMSQMDLAAANQARQDATASIVGGVGNVFGAFAQSGELG